MRPLPEAIPEGAIAALADPDDSNHDGVIDSSDALYASLKIGRDFNRNGVFEATEVFSLAQGTAA